MKKIEPKQLVTQKCPRQISEINVLRVVIVLSVALFFCFGSVAYTAFVVSGPKVLLFLGLILGLFYCTLAYQVFRYGAALRGAVSMAKSIDMHGSLLHSNAPKVTILIPSFKEEPRVIMATVLSAALAVYRNKRIVVLVDDPLDDPVSLRATYAAVTAIREHLTVPRNICSAALSDPLLCQQRVSFAYNDLADWLTKLGNLFRLDQAHGFAHVDEFLIEKVIIRQAEACRTWAQEVLQTSDLCLDRERDRLASLFSAEITSFHRKSFSNLSTDRNKAMNLNAYISLIGRSFNIAKDESQPYLRPAQDRQSADLVVPPTDYIMTLDADSIVLPDYLMTIVESLESDPTAAVAQTPYLSFPGSKAAVELIAGATTDIQYLIHQGSSYFGSAYWVGANAVLRYKALQDIATCRRENNHDVAIFIQDKTVIEDTGSTIDLWKKGWHINNHFLPLAYSATPSDFGALAIQRKRWGNGGLLLFADLFRDYVQKRALLKNLPKFILRAHYLLSSIIGNIGILLLMVFSTSLSQPLLWVIVFMLPYFLLYSYDMAKMGYAKRNIFAVCSLNLMLLPVNLSGLIASVIQIATGRKDSFLRTPKIASRSQVSPTIFIFNVSIFALMINYVLRGVFTGDFLGAIVPMINVSLYGYGIVKFMGLRGSLADSVEFFTLGVKGLIKARLSTYFGFKRRSLLVFTLTFLALTSYPFNPETTATEVPLDQNTTSKINEGIITR